MQVIEQGTNGQEEVIVEETEDQPQIGLVSGTSAVENEVLGPATVARRKGPKGLDPALIEKIKALHAGGMTKAADIVEHLLGEGTRVNYATVRKYIGQPLPSHEKRGASKPRKAKAATKRRAAAKPRRGGARRRSSNGHLALGSVNEGTVKLALQLAQLAKSLGVPVSAIQAACPLAETLAAAMG